jgi:hypothetical protein
MHCSRVDAFRHRAALIITQRTAVGHGYHRLTLTVGRSEGVPGDERHAPGIVTDIQMGP